MTLQAAPSRFAPKMMAAEWRALWRFGALARHIGETMPAVRRAESSGARRSTRLHRRISHDTRGRTVAFCAKNDGGGIEGLMAFLSLLDTSARRCRRVRRAESSGGRRSRRLYRRISHDTQGRTVAFCAKNDGGGMEGLIGVLGTVGGALRMNAGAYGTQFGRSSAKRNSIRSAQFQAEVRSPVRIRERKRRTGWRGPTLIICGGAKGSSACGRISDPWPGCEGSLRSSRTQRAKKASAVTSIHCSSNAAISLRRLAAWFRRESSKLSSEVSDASCK